MGGGGRGEEGDAFCHNKPVSYNEPLPPSVNTKRKKRNRIMHVFPKNLLFMITLNFFVYYYLCIIEIECTLFFTKAPVFHSDIYFYELQNCSFSPPTF